MSRSIVANVSSWLARSNCACIIVYSTNSFILQDKSTLDLLPVLQSINKRDEFCFWEGAATQTVSDYYTAMICCCRN
jgi:hypothetical protein